VPQSPRLPWRIIVVSTVLASLAALATYVVLDGGDDDTPTTASAVELVPDEDLPTFDEAIYTTFDGEEVPLRSLRGTPTVINFFASDCVPCITEMPAFEEVHQQVGDGGEVAFLGLAVADRAEDALELVEDTGVTYPTAQDRDASVITILGGTVLPTTVLLDADGNVASTHAGELSANELRAALVSDLGVKL
jgi:thiol-disulfide isomerase/thioredoxin